MVCDIRQDMNVHMGGITQNVTKRECLHGNTLVLTFSSRALSPCVARTGTDRLARDTKPEVANTMSSLAAMPVDVAAVGAPPPLACWLPASGPVECGLVTKTRPKSE